MIVVLQKSNKDDLKINIIFTSPFLYEFCQAQIYLGWVGLNLNLNLSKTKLSNLLSRSIINLFTLKFNFKIQLQTLTSNLYYKHQLKSLAFAELGPAQP